MAEGFNQPPRARRYLSLLPNPAAPRRVRVAPECGAAAPPAPIRRRQAGPHPPGPIHPRTHPPAAAFGADQPLAPTGCFDAVPSSRLGGSGSTDAGSFAPSAQPNAAGGSIAERHRWSLAWISQTGSRRSQVRDASRGKQRCSSDCIPYRGARSPAVAESSLPAPRADRVSGGPAAAPPGEGRKCSEWADNSPSSRRARQMQGAS
jgi:hypothetical protein